MRRFSMGLLGCCLLSGACTVIEQTPIEAIQVDGVWVFAYEGPPISWMHALGGGELAIVDDCLEMDGALVVWTPELLDEVADVIASVKAGEPRRIAELGGGMLSRGNPDDEYYPEEMFDCASPDVWETGETSMIVLEND
ncbi:MAG: hypothetical protein AAFV53_30510 [Myxococcota bacterium]